MFGQTCGGTLYDASGWIAAPVDESGEYLYNADCEWIITADEGNIILFGIEEMDIEYYQSCSADYLLVSADILWGR